MGSKSQEGNQKPATIRVPVRKDRAHRRGNGACLYMPDVGVQNAFVQILRLKESNCVAVGSGFCVISEDEEIRLAGCPERFVDKLKKTSSDAIVEDPTTYKPELLSTEEEEGPGCSLRPRRASAPPVVDIGSIDPKTANACLSPITYVVFGAGDSYFFRRSNGEVEWRAAPAFALALREGLQAGGVIKKVALGPHSSYVILWDDGSIEFSNVVQSLAEALEGGFAAEGVHDVAIGPNDEWAVLYGDQGIVASNLNKACQQKMQRIQQGGGRVRDIVFGDNGAFYFRFFDPNRTVEESKRLKY